MCAVVCRRGSAFPEGPTPHIPPPLPASLVEGILAVHSKEHGTGCCSDTPRGSPPTPSCELLPFP